MEKEVDLLDGVLSDLVKEIRYLLVKKLLLVMEVGILGIKKVLLMLVDLLLPNLLLVDGLLNLFLVYILLRMEDGEERMEDTRRSTHGLDLRVVLEMDGIVDLLLLENNDILCILAFYEVIALPFNALVGAFCSPSLCRHFEPIGIVKGHILIVKSCFDQIEGSRFMNGMSEFVYCKTEVPGVWN
jgi:hypothetical protein